MGQTMGQAGGPGTGVETSGVHLNPFLKNELFVANNRIGESGQEVQ